LFAKSIASVAAPQPLKKGGHMQIRIHDLPSSDEVVSIVSKAINAHREDVERGALLSMTKRDARPDAASRGSQ
jgi:hypothetical protein